MSGASGLRRYLAVSAQRAIAASAIALAAILPADVHAQDVPPGIFEAADTPSQPGEPTIFGLPDLGWAKPARRIGLFTLDGKAELSALFNSNVIPSAGNKQSDVALRLAPFIQIRTQNAGMDLSAYVRGVAQRYSDVSNENFEGLTGGIKLSRAFTRSVAIHGVVEGTTSVEDRFSQFVQAASLTPIRYDRVYGRLGLDFKPGRFVLSPSFEVNRLAYHDNRLASAPTTPLIQDFRSLTRINPALVAGYAVTPATIVYAGAEYNERRYDRDRSFLDALGNPIATTLDSKGYIIFGGARFRPSPLTRFEVRFGYQKQYYSGGLSDPKGLYLSASFDWQPLRTLYVQASLKRDTSESGALLAGGSIRTVAKANIEYQALRDLRLIWSVEHRESKVEQLDVRSGRTRFSGEADYLLSPSFELFARGEFGCNCRSDRALERRFTQTVLLSGVRVRI